MDISGESVEKLKAMAFDCIAERDRLNNNINTIVAELERRQQEADKEDQTTPGDGPEPRKK